VNGYQFVLAVARVALRQCLRLRRVRLSLSVTTLRRVRLSLSVTQTGGVELKKRVLVLAFKKGVAYVRKVRCCIRNRSLVS